MDVLGTLERQPTVFHEGLPGDFRELERNVLIEMHRKRRCKVQDGPDDGHDSATSLEEIEGKSGANRLRLNNGQVNATAAYGALKNGDFLSWIAVLPGRLTGERNAPLR